jgi:CubicO group peptidase (beta-lactamase class C family)
VVWTETFGAARPDMRFHVMSATKPIVASAIWLLMGDGALDISRPVAHYLPEFAGNGKGGVTIEQVLLMTAGFPSGSTMAADPQERRRDMAAWPLEYEPGTRYVYHASSAHWVLAALIDEVSGTDHCSFIEERVTRPLALPRVLGIPWEQQGDIVGLCDGLDTSSGLIAKPADAVAIGIPGGGAVMRAQDLAAFYQALLHNPGGLWKPDILADATSNIRTTLPDPTFNMPANRTIGVVVGAGFGTTWGQAPRAFGWPGAGGQIGFADPDTGISFAFLQFGEADQIQAFARGYRMTEAVLGLTR